MELAMSHITSSSTDYEAITPSDSVNFTGRRMTRGLYVGGTGDVAAVRADGTAVTFSGVPAGTILPIRAIRVNSTGTTATNLDALF